MAVSNVAGVILAAGLSRRFEGNKLLAPVNGKPLARLALEVAVASRLSRVVAVVGRQAADVVEAMGGETDDPRVSFVRNPANADGQSTSVIAGLRAVMETSPAAMFLMGDQPFMEVGIVDALVAAFETTDRAIVYPMVFGRRANPAIFGQRFFPLLLALSGDTGARGIIDAHPESSLPVHFDRAEAFQDVDQVADLNNATAHEY